MTSDRKDRLDTKAVVLVLSCCLLWGLNQVATKVALAEIPPLLQAGLRSVGAALLLAAWSRWRGIPIVQRDGTARAGVAAGLMFALEFGCIFVCLQHTSASRMAVFLYLAPFVVAMGMPFIARSETLRPLQVLGLVAAFAGVVWAFAEGFVKPAAGPRQWLGDALGLGGALLWGATTLLVRASKLSTASPEKTLLWQLSVSGVALLAGAAAAGESWPAVLTWHSLGPLAFQTVVVTSGSYLLWFWLLRHYPATRISSFTLLTPVSGLLAGALLLGEPVTARLLVALAAVAGGIWVVNRR